ncbi:hypothetical protein Nmel_001427 [Mimus melanotis]
MALGALGKRLAELLPDPLSNLKQTFNMEEGTVKQKFQDEKQDITLRNISFRNGNCPLCSVTPLWQLLKFSSSLH